MAGSSNFLQFNPSNTLALSDSDYQSDAHRLNGVVPGIADPPLHNKLFMQVSTMAYAIGQVLAAANETVSDVNATALIASIKNAFQTRFFESTQQTITAGGTLTIAHGLGVAPKKVDCFLVCQTSEFGYTAGDVITAPNFSFFYAVSGSTLAQGQSIKLDNTNIIIRFANPGGGSTVYPSVDFTNGNAVSLTDANWKLLLRARG